MACSKNGWRSYYSIDDILDNTVCCGKEKGIEPIKHCIPVFGHWLLLKTWRVDLLYCGIVFGDRIRV